MSDYEPTSYDYDIARDVADELLRLFVVPAILRLTQDDKTTVSFDSRLRTLIETVDCWIDIFVYQTTPDRYDELTFPSYQSECLDIYFSGRQSAAFASMLIEPSDEYDDDHFALLRNFADSVLPLVEYSTDGTPRASRIKAGIAAQDKTTFRSLKQHATNFITDARPDQQRSKDDIESTLTDQQTALFRHMEKCRYGGTFNELRDVPDGWDDRPTDHGVEKKLKEIRKKITPEWYFTIHSDNRWSWKQRGRR